MTEQRILELLSRKLAGEISSDELSELKELMADYNEANQMQEMTDEIWRHAIEDVDVMSYYEKHKNKFNHEFQSPGQDDSISLTNNHHLSERNYRPLVFTTCGLMVLAAISYLFFTHDRPKKQITTEIAIGKGMRKQFTLPDHSRVWLNGDSRLAYAPSFGRLGQRLLTLSGEAFFEVAKDDTRPFVIKTTKFSVRALGTGSLNINAYPDDKTAKTTLINGSMEFTMNEGSKQSVLLKPGETIAVINKDQKPVGSTRPVLKQGETLLIEPVTYVSMQNAGWVSETEWKDDKLVFNNEPLEYIAKKLGRWYNLRVTVSAEIDQTHLSGAFHDQSIEEVLKTLRQMKSFHYRIDGREVEIY